MSDTKSNSPLAHLLHTCFNDPPVTMTTIHRALIVEDHPQITYTVKPVLHALAFEVDAVRTLSSASKKLAQHTYDLVILDRSLPDGDGLDLFTSVEDMCVHTRTLVVSARATSEQRAFGLLKGADDYLTKPFSSAELSARVQSLMKRSKDLCTGLRHIFYDVRYDYEQHRLYFSQEYRQLTPGEAKLFELFLRHPSLHLTREAIATHLWPADLYPTSTAVDVCIKRLRDRLIRTALCIVTVRRTGYVLECAVKDFQQDFQP